MSIFEVFVSAIFVNNIVLSQNLGQCPYVGCSKEKGVAIGMGLGFTMSLTFLGAIRELLGAGTLFGKFIMPEGFEPFTIMVEAPGAFICLGLILALMNFMTHWQIKRRNETTPFELLHASQMPSCGGACPGCSSSQNKG